MHFEVEVTYGEKIARKFCYRSAKLSIQGFELCTDHLVVPLGDAQVILGMVWLKSLGSTLWDFTRKTLHFWKKGRAITLQGVPSKEIDVIEDKLL